jgi:hypothetical protein
MKDIHWFRRATTRSETVIYDDERVCIVFVGSLLEQVPGFHAYGSYSDSPYHLMQSTISCPDAIIDHSGHPS